MTVSVCAAAAAHVRTQTATLSHAVKRKLEVNDRGELEQALVVVDAAGSVSGLVVIVEA